jgi:hypothetical protein
MKALSLLTIGLLFSFLSNSQTLSKINWSSDIDFLANELSQRHYNFFTIKSKTEFLAGLDKIKSTSAALTNFEVALKLQQLIAGFGDAHTNVNYGQFIEKNKILPFQMYWFSDGLYILQTTKENSELLGRQIVSLNGVPLKRITDSLSTLITKDNPSMIKNATLKLLPLVQVLEYFKFVKGEEIKLEVKDVNGITRTHMLKPVEMNRENRKIVTPDSLALCFRNERIFFIDYYQATDKIYYLQYNKCWSKELELQNGNAQNAEKMPSFKKFEEKVFQTLNTNSMNSVIVDMRFNGGGSSAQGSQFAAKLARFMKKDTHMKTYVILGRNTFSSAILNAMDFKRLTNAVFVGEETAGKPNHFGEVKNFQLPGSGLKVDYSTKYFKQVNEEVGSLIPDVKLEPSFADFVKGNDPAYEWIRKQ